MNKAGRPAGVAIACLVAAACAVHRHDIQAYRLVSVPAGEILIPPGASIRDLARRRLTLTFPAGTGPCDGEPDALEVARRGARLRLRVDPERLAKEPPEWLAGRAAALERQGCIRQGAASDLAVRIAESIPLPLNSGFQLLHPNDRQTGQVDIEPDMRLEVISPILKQGAAADSPIVSGGEGNALNVTLEASSLIGYERALYRVIREEPQMDLAIIPEYAERHIQDEIQRTTTPARNYFRLASRAAYLRLFYKSGDTGFTAILLGARTRAELDGGSKRIESGSCEKIAAPSCAAIPKRVAINPLIPVTVNGEEAFAAWGSTAGDVVRAHGERFPERVLGTLTVARAYRDGAAAVKFDPRDPAILRLVLTGGEAISWRRSAPLPPPAGSPPPPPPAR